MSWVRPCRRVVAPWISWCWAVNHGPFGFGSPILIHSSFSSHHRAASGQARYSSLVFTRSTLTIRRDEVAEQRRASDETGAVPAASADALRDVVPGGCTGRRAWGGGDGVVAAEDFGDVAHGF